MHEYQRVMQLLNMVKDNALALKEHGTADHSVEELKEKLNEHYNQALLGHDVYDQLNNKISSNHQIDAQTISTEFDQLKTAYYNAQRAIYIIKTLNNPALV
jgi:predicted transcriptional regulator